MLKEFRDFAVKGNVIDLAVGVVIGASFGKIVNSLVNDIVMPPIGLLMGGIDFSYLAITLKPAVGVTPAVQVAYGSFINIVIEFLIVSFVIFILIKQINRFKRNEAKKTVSPPDDVLLLREIRDLLKKKK